MKSYLLFFELLNNIQIRFINVFLTWVFICYLTKSVTSLAGLNLDNYEYGTSNIILLSIKLLISLFVLFIIGITIIESLFSNKLLILSFWLFKSVNYLTLSKLSRSISDLLDLIVVILSRSFYSNSLSFRENLSNKELFLLIDLLECLETKLKKLFLFSKCLSLALSACELLDGNFESLIEVSSLRRFILSIC